MAINHTPPDRTRVGGARLANALFQLETANRLVLTEIATMMETVDGGEGNAGDNTKMLGVQAAYSFLLSGAPSSDAAVAAIGQLQAIRGALNATGAQAALEQAFNRLRG